MRHVVGTAFVILLAGGCAQGISKQTREHALKNLSPVYLLENLNLYRGKLVLMGGEIVDAERRGEGIVAKIRHQPLSSDINRPLDRDAPLRFFLLRYSGMEDPRGFRPGRKITVAGAVAGKQVSTSDGKEEAFLVLDAKEAHLWREWPETYTRDPSRYYLRSRYPYSWYPQER